MPLPLFAFVDDSTTFNQNGWWISVTNNTGFTDPITLHADTKTFAITPPAKGKSGVTVADPGISAFCNLHPPTLRLEGAHVDTRVRHLTFSGAPAFSTAVVQTGAAVTPGGQSFPGFVSGAVVGSYACGNKLKVSLRYYNPVATIPGFVVRLFDVDGTKVGETTASLAGKAETTVTIETTAPVSGRVGSLRTETTPASGQSAHVIVSQVQSAWSLKVTD